MTIALGSDHAAYLLRDHIAAHARARGFEVEIYGATGPEAYDYPDAADALVPKVLEGSATLGVLCCGTGIGITIRANRHHGIRAANCTCNVMASLARQHNDANILGLGARILSKERAVEIFDTFVDTQRSPEIRHLKRVEKIDAPIND